MQRSEPLRIAVAGCGRMGQLHCERLLRDGRGRVTALFDVDSTAALRLQKNLAPEAVLYSRFGDMVDSAQAGAAIICTPTQLHFEQATAFLRRGIPVLCEKPLCRSESEIVKLIEIAGQRPAVLCVAYQRRLWATYRTMRRLVGSGELGRVRAVLSHNVENWQQTIGGTWRDDPEANPGGFVGDAGSHKIDIVFFVTGLEPTEVYARCDTCGSRVETTASLSALLSGGVPLTMDFIGHAQHLSEILTVHCEKADLTLREGELWMSRQGATERVSLLASDSNPIVAFLDTLLLGAENFAPPQCALPVYRFTNAILESARSGKPAVLHET